GCPRARDTGGGDHCGFRDYPAASLRREALNGYPAWPANGKRAPAVCDRRALPRHHRESAWRVPGGTTGHPTAAQPGALPDTRPPARWRPARAAYVALWHRLLSGRPHRRHRHRYLRLDLLAGRVRSVRAL